MLYPIELLGRCAGRMLTSQVRFVMPVPPPILRLTSPPRFFDACERAELLPATSPQSPQCKMHDPQTALVQSAIQAPLIPTSTH